MSDVFNSRVKQARSHYPANARITEPAPYRRVKPTNTQFAKPGPVRIFEYEISAGFTRLHYNPPLWLDLHPHDFKVTLHLEAPCYPTDLYGLDMVEAENLLKLAIADLPPAINDSPDCPDGTTEQLCEYFAKIQFPDPEIRIKTVKVHECPERATILRLY